MATRTFANYRWFFLEPLKGVQESVALVPEWRENWRDLPHSKRSVLPLPEKPIRELPCSRKVRPPAAPYSAVPLRSSRSVGILPSISRCALSSREPQDVEDNGELLAGRDLWFPCQSPGPDTGRSRAEGDSRKVPASSHRGRHACNNTTVRGMKIRHRENSGPGKTLRADHRDAPSTSGAG